MIIDTNPSNPSDKRIKRFTIGKNFIRMNTYTDPQAAAAAEKRKATTAWVRSGIIKSRLAPIVKKVALANEKQLEEMNIEVEINPHFVSGFTKEAIEMSVETPPTEISSKKTSPEQSLANLQRIARTSSINAKEIQEQMLYDDARKRENQRLSRKRDQQKVMSDMEVLKHNNRVRYSCCISNIIDEIYHEEYTK